MAVTAATAASGTPLPGLESLEALAGAAYGPQTVRETRAELAAIQQAIKARFESGVQASELVRQRAQVIDTLLRSSWRLFGLGDDATLALIAVGGYGRGELHPCSDIDILVLLGDERLAGAATDRVRALVTFIWDIGLELGHSVRTLDQCVEEALGDVTVATSIMESRLLCGAPSLFEALLQHTGPEVIWPSHAFFEAKCKEQLARHRKFDDTAYNLEPNVREGPGGLRDIQMVAWVAKRHFGALALDDLVDHGFLTRNEHQSLIDGQDFLWQVRFALHLLTGRREDRLLFDYQRTLAEQFGYCDDDANLAVEQFMKRYYRAIRELSGLNEMLLELFEEAFLPSADFDTVVPINRRFHARGGFLEIADEGVFKRYPFALLELFLVLQQHRELRGVRASTIRQVRDHRYLINEKFRQDIRCRSLFVEIFRQPAGITHALRRMHRYGVLAAYLPAFGAVVGQMQYDLFHVYTVDEHSLKVLGNVRAFALAEKRDDDPELAAIFDALPKPELLYLAGLFHDLAKGRSGDHSELGAAGAAEFCTEHGLSAYDARLTAWLVRHHLLMSTTSQRLDITDPDVINAFAERVGDATHLNYLYLLTIADIRGTNPTLFNDWKRTLLRDLFAATARALRRGLENPIDRGQLIRETQAHAMALLANKSKARELWKNFGDDYFLRHTADEIAWHAQAILSAEEHDLPLVLVRNGRGGVEVFVYAEDQEFLFAATTSALGRLGLNILDSRIITSDNGMTLDSYVALDFEDGAGGVDREAAIATTLRNLLMSPGKARSVDSRLPRRQLVHFDIETRVDFTVDRANRRTVMEVITADRPGLLGRIGWALADCGVRLQNAKITTFGERAEDVFFVTGTHDRPLAASKLAAVEAAIKGALSDPAAVVADA